MNGEGPPVPEWDPREAAQLVLRLSDLLQHPVLVEPASRTVIGTMPVLLHLNKLVGEVLYFIRESLNIPMSATPSRISVFQRPVDLEPRALTAAGVGTANERIRAAACDGVKQSVVGGADGSTEVSLTWTSPCVGLGKVPRRGNEVSRRQLTAASGW